jgi:2-oxoisovalerate dehydrogenase E1 component
LGRGSAACAAPAHDVSAACSGYLYALGAAVDFLHSRPEGRVLVVTAEVMSPLLDLNDFDTAFLFGDAATATVVAGEAHAASFRARLHRPVLAARGEDGSALAVPFPGSGRHMRMKGGQVFTEAVRTMSDLLDRACAAGGTEPGALSLVVPHQANGRILEAVARRTGARTFSNIRSLGNTSSSSIPLALVEVLAGAQAGDRLGLCAFGGGFTSGAALLDVTGRRG